MEVQNTKHLQQKAVQTMETFLGLDVSVISSIIELYFPRQIINLLSSQEKYFSSQKDQVLRIFDENKVTWFSQSFFMFLVIFVLFR